MSAREKILHSMTRSDFVRSMYGVLRELPVVGTGVQKLVHAAMPVGTRLWIRIPEGLGKGLWMYVDPRFELGYANGDHEPWIQEILKSELRPGDCYYDVGAHTGFFSLIASRFVGPSGGLVAVEPDPENAALLRANLAKNGIEHAAVLEAAVWSSPGEVTFEQALNASNRTQGRIASTGDSWHAHITVPAIRLDDVVFGEGRPAPHLIKMDVEGAEWEVLQGARRLLSEAKPKLLCEVHDRGQMGQIRGYLEKLGYLAEEWTPVHQHYADYHQAYLWAVPLPHEAATQQGSRA